MSKVKTSIFIILLGIFSPLSQARVLSGRFVKNFTQLREDLSKKEVARVKAGHSLFTKPWVQAPSSTLVRNGLGPHFNAVSCLSCHPAYGRGAPPHVIHPKDPALLFKVNGPAGAYGAQIQPLSILGVTAETQVSIEYEEMETQLREVTLTKPLYKLENEQYGPLKSNQYLSPRIAPHLAGLGYLNQISDEEILKNQANGGKPNMIEGRIGRFGWKADRISLRHQVAAAFQGDLGITNSLFPKQPCTDEQIDCMAAPTGVEEEYDFEIIDKHLDYVVELMSAIAPPKRQIIALKSESIFRGEKVFKEVNCQSCHRESYKIENDLSIHPYTDLLVHDMGEGLADEGNTKEARLWRTAPLWGLGSQNLVNGHMRLLHDGRARGIEEAIAWHGGEAHQSKKAFIKLSPTDRADLLNFLSSL